MVIFGGRSFWKDFCISHRMIQKKYKSYFGDKITTIDNRDNAISLLMNISDSIQAKMIRRIKSESTYGMLLKLYFIFGEVHSQYLKEKELRCETRLLYNDNKRQTLKRARYVFSNEQAV